MPKAIDNIVWLLSDFSNYSLRRISWYDFWLHQVARFEKAGISFELANKKIGMVLSMLLLTGCHKFPDHKIYWDATLDNLCKRGLIQCLLIYSRVFFRIFIFVITNNLINKTNRRSSFQWLITQIGDF